MLDHSPLTIEQFGGLWLRSHGGTGKQDSCPPDHFQDCDNVQFVEGGFRSRDGIIPELPYSNVLKIYTYVTNDDDSLLVVKDGQVFHSASPTPFDPILEVDGMTDIGFVSINGRAYISPNNSFIGLPGEFVYVYQNDGVPARKAAGQPPTDADGALAAANSGNAGNVEHGFRVYAVVYETDTGFLTRPGPDTFATLLSPGGETVDLSNIPVSPNSYVVKRHIVATRAIVGYNGDQDAYQFFFVPDGTIEDNTTTTLEINFFDSALLDDASYLLEVLAEIPASLGLTTYRSRMVSYGDSGTVRISVAGEPEAFNEITGLVLLPRDSKPTTNAQEYRDVLYLFKEVKSYAVQDNGQEPSFWLTPTLIDGGLGAPLHGIACVLQLQGTTIELLIISNYSGIYMFNGMFNKPELSYKIADYWKGLNFSDFVNIQTYIDTIRKVTYIILPDRMRMLIMDFQNGLDPKNVRFAFWTFDVEITTICLFDFNTLLIGSRTGI